MSIITDVKQANFIDTKKVEKCKIKMYGIGSIGSILMKQAALVGFKSIMGYDMDTVDADNMGSQEFTKEHLGMKKTKAIQKLMKDWYNFDVEIVEGEITKDTEILPEENTIYFCGFDSLKARKILWDKLKTFPIIWGESRIGRTSQRFYFVDLINRDEKWIEEYNKTLDPNNPRTELQCGDKGCYPSNAELVSKIVRQMVNIAEGKPFARMMISDWGYPPAIYVAPKEEVPKEIKYD